MFEKLLNESHQLTYYPSLLALAIFLFCVYLVIQSLFSPGKNNKKLIPPSPPKLPIIGNLHQLTGHLPHHSLASLSQKYGPLMSLQLGNKLAVVISSAAVVREIIKNCDIPFSGKPTQIASEKLFYGRKDLIFSPYGDHWRKMRSLVVNHLLHKRMTKSFKSIRDEETSNLVEYINQLIIGSTNNSTPVINLSTTFSSLANDVVCKAAFGKKYTKTKEGNKIMEIIEETTQFLFKITVGEFIPWLAWINRWNGFEAALDKLMNTKEKILDSKIQEYLETSSTEGLIRDGCGDNFANILASALDGSTPGLSIDLEMAKAVIQNVLGAGTDTTAAALGWAMTELIRQPKTMRKLQDEVRGIMKGKQSMITDEELEKMQYLKAVVKEALRLHCPVPVNLRETIDDVQMMGYNIPSGTMVMFNLWAICRDPAYWDEPEKFLPERFLNCSLDYKGLDFQFVPFGFGRRACPGISFSNATMEHVLANLMHKFDWHLPNGVEGEDLDVDEKPGLVVKKKNPLLLVPSKC